MNELSPKERKYLRKFGHELKSIIQIGHKGLTEGVVAQIERALIDHELIKVKVGNNSEVATDDIIAPVTTKLECALVQNIGGVVMLYRAAEHPDDRKIRLPDS